MFSQIPVAALESLLLAETYQDIKTSTCLIGDYSHDCAKVFETVVRLCKCRANHTKYVNNIEIKIM